MTSKGASTTILYASVCRLAGAIETTARPLTSTARGSMPKRNRLLAVLVSHMYTKSGACPAPENHGMTSVQTVAGLMVAA